MTSIKKKSLVWKYFGEVHQGKVECLICNHVLKYHKDKSTSHLLKHLRSNHRHEARPIFDSGKFSTVPYSYCDDVNIQLKSHSEDHDLQSGPEIKKVMVDCDASKYVTPITFQNVPERGKLNRIWAFFKLEPDDGKGVRLTSCRTCGTIIKFHGYTNLKKHLKFKHPESLERLNEALSNYESSFGAAIPKQRISRAPARLFSTMDKKNDLDEKVIAMIAVDLQPVSIVERKGFVDLMSTAVPNYTLPSRKSLTTELLPNLYKHTLDRVLQRLEGIDYIALTTDSWSPRKLEIYMSVTAHFISPTDWTLKSVMLSTTTFYGSPNSKDISAELQRVVTEWNILDKITVMVTDNVTNTLLANEQLSWAYIPCLGQLIHLVVTDAISADKEAMELIEKVEDIVSFFHHNHEANQNLITTQRSLEIIVSGNKLAMSTPSRWNSLFYMLEDAYKKLDAINAVLEIYEMSEKCISSSEREMIKKIISSLKPFEVATASLTSNQSNNISVALPLIKGVVKMMSSVTGAQEPLTEALRQGLIQSFGKIDEIECIIAATLLDPRFKKFPFAEKEVIEKAKQIITSEVAKILGMDEPDSSGDAKHAESPVCKIEDPFWEFLDTMTTDAQESKEVVPSAASREVQRYLESPPVPKDENILVYWKQHVELFPNLCKVALKYLTVPITSVPFDRLFTKAGDNLVERRSMLKPKNVNMVLFLNKNL